MQAAHVIEVQETQVMNVTARVRATKLSTPRSAKPSWQHHATSIALVVGAFVMGYAPLDSQINAQRSADAPVAGGISSDPNAKSARDAKRAERAAARDAKKKERASRSSKSDDRSLAKAKSSKSSSGSSVDLGDNDPLEGL
jgi:hypothetical protein